MLGIQDINQMFDYVAKNANGKKTIGILFAREGLPVDGFVKAAAENKNIDIFLPGYKTDETCSFDMKAYVKVKNQIGLFFVNFYQMDHMMILLAEVCDGKIDAVNWGKQELETSSLSLSEGAEFIKNLTCDTNVKKFRPKFLERMYYRAD